MFTRRHVCVMLLFLPAIAVQAADAVYQEDFEGQSAVRWRGAEVVTDAVQGKVLSVAAAESATGRVLTRPVRDAVQVQPRGGEQSGLDR